MRAIALVLALLCPGLCAAAGMSPRGNYLLYCSGCHGTDGVGSINGGIPAFEGSVDRLANDKQGRLYMMHVPGVVSAALSDSETAEVTNYILDHWGADAPRFTAEEVRETRAIPVPDVVVLRREIAARMKAAGTPLSNYPWP